MLWWHNGLSWWGWLSMSLVMVGFWGLVIWGVVSLSRSADTPDSGKRDAKDVLAERFAAGEIDEAQYRERLAVLQG
jgi:putative membrane protein